MKFRLFQFLVLTAALLLTAGPARAAKARPETTTTAALKRATDRYALTKARIAALLDRRIHPSPLPANLPNPFYYAPALPPGENQPAAVAEEVAVPAAPDISDADTLAKFAATVKISGVVVLNGQPHLTLNQSLCKAGDVIPAGSKQHPVYIQVLRITPDELTLGLNQAEQTVRLRN